jgi:hypothetical protein
MGPLQKRIGPVCIAMFGHINVHLLHGGLRISKKIKTNKDIIHTTLLLLALLVNIRSDVSYSIDTSHWCLLLKARKRDSNSA